MKGSLTLVSTVVVLSAGPAFAQTADHAPTKPAADAAAKYDKGLRQSGSTKGADDGSPGAAASETKRETAPVGGKTAPPESTSDTSK